MSQPTSSGPPERGNSRGFGGRGASRGPRGRGRGGRRPREPKEDTWVPVTKLGRLVLENKITSLNEIFYHSLKIKEFQIVDHFYSEKQAAPGVQISMNQLDTTGKYLHETVMSIKPVQKQTSAGQRTRFKAHVLVGNCDGHVGLGAKCAKEVATAIRGAVISAKLNIMPVRMGHWGKRIGAAHTIPVKLSAKVGSVKVRLIPAPRGTGVVGSPTTKKVLFYAGVADCFSSASGQTCTRGNFAKAVFDALRKSYSFLTPDMWAKRRLKLSLYEQHACTI